VRWLNSVKTILAAMMIAVIAMMTAVITAYLAAHHIGVFGLKAACLLTKRL